MDESLRFLIIEDKQPDFLLIEALLKQLRKGAHCSRVATVDALKAALHRGGWNLVLSDYGIPEMSFLECLDLVRTHMPDVPIILVSGSVGEEKAVELLKQGVWDFVLKDRLARLVPAIERSLRDAEDMADKKRMEEELRSSARMWNNTFDAMTDAISIMDQKGMILRCNKAMIELMDKRPDEIVNHFCWEVVHHSDQRIPGCPFPRMMKSGRRESMTTELLGRRFNVTLDPIMDQSGNLIGIVHIMSNVTEKCKLEQQLRHAQKMEAVGQLTSGIAHDFNNFLSAIIGFATLLQMKMKKDDPLRSFVDQILSGTERAAILTQSLLTFSTKQISSPRPVDVNIVIRRVEKLLKSIIGEDIELRTAPAHTQLIVNADAGQIEQVLMNLATNARDAMPNGGIISIETASVDSDVLRSLPEAQSLAYALISVSDTGVGMDETTREKIFEPFFTTKDPGSGTGLGLSMVYGIIKQHSGFIFCYSERGIGTTFKIYLPLIRAEDILPGTDKAQLGATEQPAGGTETVLVAEDDQAVRLLVKTTLEAFGYTVIDAVDGKDAIKRFLQNRDKIRLVLCDVIMPEMSGPEAREAIKKESPDMPVLFMSGYSTDILGKKWKLDQADVISKPFSLMALLRKIREVLDQNQAARSGT